MSSGGNDRYGGSPGKRRLEALIAVEKAFGGAPTREDACRAVADALAENTADHPYVLVYLLDEAGGSARLVANVRCEPAHGAPVPLAGGEEAFSVALGKAGVVLPSNAIILPLTEPAEGPSSVISQRRLGFLVSGAGPREPDDEFAAYLQLCASRLASAISCVRERERALELVSGEPAHRDSQGTAEAERDRFRDLLGQIPAIVNFLRGPELVVDFIHPMASALLGDRDVAGAPLLEAIPELGDQEYPALLRRVLETGVRIDGKEKLVRLADEAGGFRETYWNSVYLPVRDAEGRIDGVMTFDLEVTEQLLARRKIEEQARQLVEAHRQANKARALAETANRAKDEFLAMLGHEMRNPLAPIRTSLQLMRMRGIKSREQSVIERQVDHLVRLVDDLLDISRITRGKIELKRERLELARAVIGGVEMASPLLEERRQQVDMQVPSKGLQVAGDRERLAQVVSNLITNAAKYSEPGTTIHIRAESVGPMARLKVRDEGGGIAPDVIGNIFEPFVQQPQSSERSKGGLGLGLTIVRSLVELHGGSVTAASEGAGKGSEFIIELPLAREGEIFRKPLLGRFERPLPTGSRRLAASTRVLVVDDNADAADSLADILGELGYEVVTANDGPTALKLVKDFRPHICLLDIGLPVMDGYELAQHLRKSKLLPEGARIVAITGYGQEADRLRSTEAGFNAHLVKPVSLDALTRTLMN